MLVLAETLVTAFCHALGFDGIKRRPEIDMYELAERAGAEAKIEHEMREDGRVEESPLATRIILCSTPAEARRRFTLGHELGHLVLSDPRVFRLVQLEFEGERFQVEHLCDAFSAELLMPRKWLANRYERADERFDVLCDLAREAGVSYTAGFTRLATVLRWRSSLLYLRREDWTLTVVGGPLQLEGVELDSGALDTLRDLAPGPVNGRRGESKSLFEEVDLNLWDESHRLACELRPTRKGIWILVMLPRHPNPAEGERPEIAGAPSQNSQST